MQLESRLDVTVDHAASFAFTLTNNGTDPVQLEFTSGIPAEFTIYEDGTEVWRWGQGKMFTQMLEMENLSPDESVTYTGTWSDPKPGVYTVKAVLQTTNASVEEVREFVVD